MASSLPSTLVFMGVCGCGKSVVGELFAREVGGLFDDSDAFHPPANVAKMSAGTPLTDEDRAPWLAALRARIVAQRGRSPCHVLACSALKQRYRDVLRGEDDATQLQFVYLHGSRELIGERMAARRGHFMPPSLIDSQFAALEEPADALWVSIDQPPEAIVREIKERLSHRI